MELKQIGTIYTPFEDRAGTPVQPAYAEGAVGEVVLDPLYAQGLTGIEGFEKIWLLFWMDRCGPLELEVVPHRKTTKRGLFATRAPSRPNPIGISCVRLLERKDNRLRVENVDILDGTPLLDIKPGIPRFDSGLDPGSGRPPRQHYETREETSGVFARHVSPGKVKLYETVNMDVVMGQRSGVYFQDAFSDRKLINCHCNGGVFNLGHRNPRILRAVDEALDTVDIGNHHLISGHRARLAQRLAATTDQKLDGVVFGVGGGEAIDLALKVARGVTSRQKVVSIQGGYHGHTGLALATGDAQYRDLFGPNLPGFTQVPFDDLPAMEQAIDDHTSAVILEPIPATLGMPIPSEGYLEGVCKLCRERGAKLILDEVQTGLGRTGKIWCYQHHEITPDAIVVGKGLSGGIYPITATLMTREMHSIFDENPFIHISTFGGAEPGCAAGIEVLDMIEEPGFLEGVNQVSDRIAEALEPLIFEVRRRGLMMGFKFPEADGAMVVTKMFYEAGIYSIYANNDTSVLQFLPPLIIGDAELEDLIGRIKHLFG